MQETLTSTSLNLVSHTCATVRSGSSHIAVKVTLESTGVGPIDLVQFWDGSNGTTTLFNEFSVKLKLNVDVKQ